MPGLPQDDGSELPSGNAGTSGRPAPPEQAARSEDPAPGDAVTASDPLARIIWESLVTSHAPLAQGSGKARLYASAVAPFAAISEPTASALLDLEDLLDPGEAVYLLGDRPPETPGLQWDGTVPCLQMIFPAQAALPITALETSPILPLDCSHAPEMLELIAVAYPGYFRSETCRMGRYFGIRAADGSLIAMGGERLVCHPWREISGLCSHPAHPGKGLGTALLSHLLRLHRAEGSRSWLWVVESNGRAIDLYQRLGFTTLRRSDLHRLRKQALHPPS